MPRRDAPAMSAWRESPTWTTSCGRTRRDSRAASKIRGRGLYVLADSDVITASNRKPFRSRMSIRNSWSAFENDGSRNSVQSGEDRGHLRVGLRLPPQRDEVVHVRSRVPLDSVLAERLPEAALRDFFQGEKGFPLRAEEVTVPGCEERLRIERESVVIAHGARDPNQDVPARVDDRPERVERDRADHVVFKRTAPPLSLSAPTEVATGLPRTGT